MAKARKRREPYRNPVDDDPFALIWGVETRHFPVVKISFAVLAVVLGGYVILFVMPPSPGPANPTAARRAAERAEAASPRPCDECGTPLSTEERAGVLCTACKRNRENPSP